MVSDIQDGKGKPVDPMSNRQLAADKRIAAKAKAKGKAKVGIESKGSGKGKAAKPKGKAAKPKGAAAKPKGAAAKPKGAPAKRPAAAVAAVRGDSSYGAAKKIHRAEYGAGWTEAIWRSSAECQNIILSMPKAERQRRKLCYLLEWVQPE